MTGRRVGAVVLAAVACFGGGCEQSTPPPPPVREPHPPLLAMQRALAYSAHAEYVGLFTDDFRFHFSAQSDSGFDALYGGNWTLDDESEATKHLFFGYVDASGTNRGAASNFAVAFLNDRALPDPDHADSLAQYVYVPVGEARLTFDVFGDGGQVLHYEATAPESFWLVRGDAARLRAGQPPDSSHWYIRAWQDLAQAADSARADSTGRVIRTTWGRVRASYR